MDEISNEGRTRWGLVLLVFAAGVAGAFQVGKAPPSLPYLRVELGLSLFLAGWAVSIFSLTGVAAGLLAGAAADRLGHRRLLIGGLVISGTAGLAGSFSPGPGWLLTTRFLEGLGYVISNCAAPALIVRLARPGDLRLAMGVWSCFMPAGTSAMMLISPLFLTTVGWRGLWLVNTCLLMAVAAVLGKTTRGLRPAEPAGPPGRGRLAADVRLTLSRPGPLVLGLIFGVYALMFMAVVGFLPTLLIEEMGLGAGWAGVLTALVVAANIPGNLAGGRLLQIGVRRVVLLGGACLVMGLSGLGIYSEALPGPFRYALTLAFSGAGGMVPVSLYAATAVLSPKPSLVATTNGVMMQGASLGSTAGPPALAAVVEAAGGWSAAPWLLGAAAGVGLGLSLWLGRLEEKG